MIKRLTFFPVFMFIVVVGFSQGKWTWMHGEKSANVNRVYGAPGVESSSANPGSRIGASYWKDNQGNFWLFGGKGNDGVEVNGAFHDLWKYNPNANQWTWMGGSQGLSAEGVFTGKGLSSADNIPGARHNAVSWVDNDGNFWLFGGMGVRSRRADDGGSVLPAVVLATLNDLWKYSPATGQWTFVSGTPETAQIGEFGYRGEASSSNYPGSRYSASGWKDDSGNLWLFGGRGYSLLNLFNVLDDVWKYSPSDNMWTWMAGNEDRGPAPNYGQKGTFSSTNTPGWRLGCTSWTDRNGNFWLYGGGTVTELFSDLWRYDHVTNRWAWISGSKERDIPPDFSKKGVPETDAHPGARTLSSVWVDESNNAWIFGGNVNGGLPGPSNPQNSLWKYSTSTNEWTFVMGDNSDPSAVYGTKGVEDNGNMPGGMTNSAFWEGPDGKFWVFGGRRTATDYINQVWRLSIGCNQDISGNITPAAASICAGGSAVLTATGGTSYEWKLNGQTINGQTGSALTVNSPGTYSLTIINGTCSGPAANTSELIVSETNGIRYTDISATENVPFRMNARIAGTSFQWSPVTGLDNPMSTAPLAVLTKNQLYFIQITFETGCSIVDTQFVSVKPAGNNINQGKVAVPRAFTPNNNNSNDLLRPLGKLKRLDYFRVYNRWGILVFQTNTIGSGWDGRHKGLMQSTDTFTWVLVGELPDGEPVKLSGKTVLIR